jgi:hypothetical protein
MQKPQDFLEFLASFCFMKPLLQPLSYAAKSFVAKRLQPFHSCSSISLTPVPTPVREQELPERR